MNLNVLVNHNFRPQRLVGTRRMLAACAAVLLVGRRSTASQLFAVNLDPASVSPSDTNCVIVTNQFNLAWIPTDTNAVTFNVYQGASTGVYNLSNNVGNVTNIVAGSTNWPTFFAVTEVDSNGNESDFSDETQFPRPATNVVTVIGSVVSGPSPNGPWTNAFSFSENLTNPPGTAFFKPGPVSIATTNISQ